MNQARRRIRTASSHRVLIAVPVALSFIVSVYRPVLAENDILVGYKGKTPDSVTMEGYVVVPRDSTLSPDICKLGKLAFVLVPAAGPANYAAGGEIPVLDPLPFSGSVFAGYRCFKARCASNTQQGSSGVYLGMVYINDLPQLPQAIDPVSLNKTKIICLPGS